MKSTWDAFLMYFVHCFFDKYNASKDTMLLSFLSVIEVRTKLLDNVAAPKDLEALNEIRDRSVRLKKMRRGEISEDAAWTEAYSLERLMALLEPLDTLLPEIRLRLDEAAAEGVSAVPRLRLALAAAEARAVNTSKNPPVIRQGEGPALRSLLLDILSETHWTMQRKFHSRPIQVSAARRIVWAGINSFALFVLPYFLIYYRAYTSPAVDIPLYTGLPLYTALTAGIFGAYFSRLQFIQAKVGQLSIGELKTARQFTSIFLRGSVGMCGALVVFFFLRSGIVDGSVFPDFSQLGLKVGSVSMFDGQAALAADQAARSGTAAAEPLRLILPSSDLALLALWCFLAGFSERLVPSILSSTERTFDGAARNTKS